MISIMRFNPFQVSKMISDALMENNALFRLLYQVVIYDDLVGPDIIGK